MEPLTIYIPLNVAGNPDWANVRYRKEACGDLPEDWSWQRGRFIPDKPRSKVVQPEVLEPEESVRRQWADFSREKELARAAILRPRPDEDSKPGATE